MIKILRSLVLLAATLLSLVIFASLFGAFWPILDSIAHFRFHLLVLLAALTVLIALFRRWRWCMALAAVWGAGVVSLSPALPFLDDKTNGAVLRLVQFNSLFNNPTADVSLKWILSQKPDFVTLQEVSSNTLAIYEGLATELPHGVFCKFATVGGVAVRSRYPLTASDCKAGQGFAWVQANVNGKSLSIASLHLHWPYPYGQWKQLANLSASFKAVPRPVVLAGDFNAAPWSAAVKTVAADTDTRVAPGLRFTLKMGAAGIGPIPFLPIDHVLLPDTASLQMIDKGPSIGSDHLPLLVRFTLD
jgi:endonuclease/exonuclease/phosphatase (EEP) superfamily protein YafD